MTKLGIDDRVDTTVEKDVFITLKDYKPNFANKPTCRLINPTKSEIGKVSKKILDRIISTIAKKRNFDQWKNTTTVINWFKSIEHKQHSSFVCLDIEEFYPFISQDLLNKALDFASDYDNITTDERNFIIYRKNSILIHKHRPWQNKGNTTLDVTMGSCDGVETCELVGSFLLSQLQDLNIILGLDRNDGLAITIPAGINKRLSSLSSDKASFDQAAPPYQKALDGTVDKEIRFDSSKTREDYKLQLRARCQKPNEDFEGFTDSLLELVKNAYPDTA